MKKVVQDLTSGGLAAVSSSFFAALYSAFGRYDVVHIHAEGPAFFAWLPKMFGKRVVVTVHGIDSISFLKIQRIMGIAALPMFRNTMKQSFRRKLHGLHIWWHPAGRSAVFEDFIGYQSSTVLDEPDREAGTTSIPIPQREESENIPSPDLPEQLENVQQSGNEIAERGMQT